MKSRSIIAAVVLLTATPAVANSGTAENKYGVITRCNVSPLPPPLWSHWIPCLSNLFRL